MAKSLAVQQRLDRRCAKRRQKYARYIVNLKWTSAGFQCPFRVFAFRPPVSGEGGPAAQARSRMPRARPWMRAGSGAHGAAGAPQGHSLRDRGADPGGRAVPARRRRPSRPRRAAIGVACAGPSRRLPRGRCDRQHPCRRRCPGRRVARSPARRSARPSPQRPHRRHEAGLEHATTRRLRTAAQPAPPGGRPGSGPAPGDDAAAPMLAARRGGAGVRINSGARPYRPAADPPAARGADRRSSAGPTCDRRSVPRPKFPAKELRRSALAVPSPAPRRKPLSDT